MAFRHSFDEVGIFAIKRLDHHRIHRLFHIIRRLGQHDDHLVKAHGKRLSHGDAVGDTAVQQAFALQLHRTGGQRHGGRSPHPFVAPGISGDFTVNDSKITTVGAGALSGNVRITSVNIPSVTRVLGYAFAYCEQLTSVNLGTLSEIGTHAFYRTSISTVPSLDGITMPSHIPILNRLLFVTV